MGVFDWNGPFVMRNSPDLVIVKTVTISKLKESHMNRQPQLYEISERKKSKLFFSEATTTKTVCKISYPDLSIIVNTISSSQVDTPNYPKQN